MGLMDKSTGISQFNGTNFSNWKFRVEKHLASHGCLEAIKTPTPALSEPNNSSEREREKIDCKAQDIITSFISDDYLEYIRDESTAFGMWKVLQDNFQRKSCQNQTLIRKELANLKLNEGGDLNSHLLKFDGLVRELKGAGATPSEHDLVSQLFVTLPVSFDAVVTALENLSDDDLNMNTVRTRLLAENQKLKNRAAESVSSNVTAFTSKKKFKPKFNGKCNNCGKFGHKKVDCRLKATNTAAISKSGISFIADSMPSCINFQSTSEIVFALDSGATDHFVNDINLFVDVKQLTYPKQICVAKTEQSIVVSQVGTIEGLSNSGVNVTLKNVLYSPEFRENLLSVSKIVQAGIAVKFEEDRAVLTKNGYTVASAKRWGNLFQIAIKIPRNAANMSKSESGNLWHKRLGHISNNCLNELIQHKMVDGIGDISLTEFCDICTQSKQCRKPFNGTRPRASRPIEHIFSDVCGPISPISWNGSKYFLTFIDDFTHFTVVYVMARKSECYEKFKEFEAEVTAKFNMRISMLTVDQGREYKSVQMVQFCKSRGIQILETIAYTPQQNGVAERFNRTIVEKARALMLQSGTPKFFWNEAIYTSAFLLNRSPTRALQSKKTPAEMWFGEKPNLTKVKIFGCRAFAWLPSQKRSKLDSKSTPMVMMGYCPNGYRLWNQNKKQIITSRDVTFNENEFPFQDRVNPKSDDKVYRFELEEEKEAEIQSEVGELQENEEIDATGVSQEMLVQDSNTEPAIEPTLRRSERIQSRNTKFSDYYNSLFETCSIDISQSNKIPNTFKEMESSADRAKWDAAVKEELESMKTNNVWKIVKKSGNVKTLKSRWIFKIKEDGVGKPIRYKARLVAKGYLQKPGLDYDETYSPVAKLSSIRIVLAVGVLNQMYFHQLDVKTAFLYGELEEDLYMEVPDGMKAEPNSILKLQKSLYGLKQSPRCWNTKFNQVLIQLGFVRSSHDYCLYTRIKGQHIMYLILYVDDVLIVGQSEADIEIIKKELSVKFEMSDCGPLKHYLGTVVEYNQAGAVMQLHQSISIQRILEDFGMAECKAARTPMEKGLKLMPTKSDELKPYPYRELLGRLMYLMLSFRPDLCYAVGYLGRFQQNPSEEHWVALKRVVRYLQHTSQMKLQYLKEENAQKLVGYVDADWGSNIEDRKSTTGYVFYVYGCPVSWCSKKQTTVATSSSEAEYVALSAATSEGIWIKGILEDMQVFNKDDKFTLYEDNTGCIAMANNLECKRSKHIDIKHHFIRDHLLKGDFKIEYVSSSNQVADIFTKALDFNTFTTIRNKLLLN